MSLPIRVRLTLWYAVLLTTIMLLLGIFLVMQLRADLRGTLDEAVLVASDTMVHAIEDERPESEEDDAGFTEEDAVEFVDVAAASLPPAGGAQLLDSRGRMLAAYGTVAGSGPLATVRDAATRSFGTARPSTVATSSRSPGYRVMATPLEDHGQSRLLVVAVSMEPVHDAVRRVLVLLLVAGPVVLIATVLAAYWLARKALRPVDRMTNDAEEIGAGHLHERIAVPDWHDEIWRLAITINAMLERIARGVRDKDRLVADASHELRTPLAVMRAELDVSLRGDDLPPAARQVLESARDEVDRVSRTVDNLLVMAATDEGRLQLLTRRADVLEIATAAVQRLRQLAAAKGVSLTAGAEPANDEGWTATVDPQRLSLALTNVIENAIKFAPDGGAVDVLVWRRAGELGVTVRDSGPGVVAEDRDRLFERYYQVGLPGATHATGGSGLGLAIAREVVLAHGGRIWVDTASGGGSSFSVAMPSWRVVPAGLVEADALAGAPTIRSGAST